MRALPRRTSRLTLAAFLATAVVVSARASVAQTPPTVTLRIDEVFSPNAPVKLAAKVVESGADRAVVEATLVAGGKVCASCRGTFVAVKPGHPAYHRW